MAHAAERIEIPKLDPKFLRDRNTVNNWWVATFNENISVLYKLAGLGDKGPWKSLKLTWTSSAGVSGRGCCSQSSGRLAEGCS
jgi:hypothetical protein